MSNFIRYLSSNFTRYVVPRDIHSFPTRRSSDLSRKEAARQAAPMAPAPAASGGPVGKPGNSLTFNVGDRKSTRLNSSHVSISYAVFCLKKKNHKQYETEFNHFIHLNYYLFFFRS